MEREFTGLKTMDGQPVYDGDILVVEHYNEKDEFVLQPMVVFYEDSSAAYSAAWVNEGDDKDDICAQYLNMIFCEDYKPSKMHITIDDDAPISLEYRRIYDTIVDHTKCK